MSKFLFFDIDGTLVGKSRHITEKLKKRFKKERMQEIKYSYVQVEHLLLL